MILKHHPFYAQYFNHVRTPENIISDLGQQLSEIIEFIESVPQEHLDYRYQEGKWTVKQVLIHCLDTERVMAYRALCLSRDSSLELEGFQQDQFAEKSYALPMKVSDISNDFLYIRKSNLSLFKFFTEDDLSTIGYADGQEISVMSLLGIIFGHWVHHQKVLEIRYF